MRVAPAPCLTPPHPRLACLSAGSGHGGAAVPWDGDRHGGRAGGRHAVVRVVWFLLRVTPFPPRLYLACALTHTSPAFYLQRWSPL